MIMSAQQTTITVTVTVTTTAITIAVTNAAICCHICIGCGHCILISVRIVIVI